MHQFVIVGLGSFGFNLAEALAEDGHQVMVIDVDEEKIEAIKEEVTHAVVADATNRKVLSELVSDDIGATIIGLDSIEASTLTLLHLRDLGISNIIVKAMSDDHTKILKALGATEVIYPEKDVAEKLAKRLSTPNLIEHIPLTPEYSIVEITPPEKFVGKTLKELQLRKGHDIIVIAVKDVLSNTFDLIPGANFRIRPDSELIIIGKKADLEGLEF